MSLPHCPGKYHQSIYCAFSDFLSFSIRIEIPGILVGKVTVISRSGKLLGLFDPLLCLRVPLEKVDCRPAAR